VLKGNASDEDESAVTRAGSTLVSFIWPAQSPDLL